MTVTVTTLHDDDALEREIAASRLMWTIAAEAAQHAPPEDAKRFRAAARREWARFQRLIARRSPARVEEMEREQGLR